MKLIPKQSEAIALLGNGEAGTLVEIPGRTGLFVIVCKYVESQDLGDEIVAACYRYDVYDAFTGMLQYGGFMDIETPQFTFEQINEIVELVSRGNLGRNDHD